MVTVQIVHVIQILVSVILNKEDIAVVIVLVILNQIKLVVVILILIQDIVAVIAIRLHSLVLVIHKQLKKVVMFNAQLILVMYVWAIK